MHPVDGVGSLPPPWVCLSYMPSWFSYMPSCFSYMPSCFSYMPSWFLVSDAIEVLTAVASSLLDNGRAFATPSQCAIASCHKIKSFGVFFRFVLTCTIL